MGTGFTIDTPLKVARYGISSVVSLVDDVLIEQMRKYHCGLEGEPYEEIAQGDPDARARRITAYLDLMDRAVRRQSRQLRESAFEPGSEITRYFEMLPDSPLRSEYQRMLVEPDPAKKVRLQDALRPKAVPGSIDVNIMTKLDRNPRRGAAEPAPENSDALSALRGYANSALESSIVFSAGLNPRLYGYAAQFPDFFPRAAGAEPLAAASPKKSIILKVGDYRSAEIQGKYLARRGLWVSEYRIESGLNCGGHAFANQGLLLGPILEDFRLNRRALPEKLFSVYAKALAERGLPTPREIPPVRITVQGGIGTHGEDEFLRRRYGVDGTGWGTPFLLVPEATNVDEEHLSKLAAATEKDVILSNGSPLNVPFWILRTAKGEEVRQKRVEEGKPGSPCVKQYLALSAEITDNPICRASRAYQKLKLDQLAQIVLSPGQRDALVENVTAKSCICHDLAGGATIKCGIDPGAAPTICCGPNIVNFSKLLSMEQITDHIYGRASYLSNPKRPHVFLKELRLNLEYYIKETEKFSLGVFQVTEEDLREFHGNLKEGIAYYKELAAEIPGDDRNDFIEELGLLEREVETAGARLRSGPLDGNDFDVKLQGLAGQRMV